MFACSTRFDQLHPEQIRAVFEALTTRFRELRMHIEYVRSSVPDATWETLRSGRQMDWTRAELRLLQGAAVAMFGVHVLKRDEFWILPELLADPECVVVHEQHG